MPHFIIECSDNVLNHRSKQTLLETVWNSAMDTGLFKPNVKVRINTYQIEDYLNNGALEDFIHVFGHIMEGRTNEQKAMLSSTIVRNLKEKYPKTPTVSMNIYEFDKASYRNQGMV